MAADDTFYNSTLLKYLRQECFNEQCLREVLLNAKSIFILTKLGKKIELEYLLNIGISQRHIFNMWNNACKNKYYDQEHLPRKEYVLGNKLLAIAAKYGHLDIIKLLYNYRLKIPDSFNEHITYVGTCHTDRPYVMAIINGHKHIVNFFHENCNKILVNLNCLRICIQKASINMIRYAFNGVIYQKIHETDALKFAITFGRIDVCEFFVMDLKVDLQIRNTELMCIAVRKNQIESIEYLINNVHYNDNEKNMIAICAIGDCKWFLVKYFINIGWFDKTCEKYAVSMCIFEKQFEMLQYLIGCGFDMRFDNDSSIKNCMVYYDGKIFNYVLSFGFDIKNFEIDFLKTFLDLSEIATSFAGHCEKRNLVKLCSYDIPLCGSLLQSRIKRSKKWLKNKPLKFILRPRSLHIQSTIF
jgi:hypothetical protein